MDKILDNLTPNQQLYAGVSLGVFTAFAALKRYFNGGRNPHFPDLNGKVIVVTGANTGIGYIAVEEMAKLGAKAIVLACRDPKRGNDAVQKIKSDHGVTNVEFMRLDLNDLTSVKAFTVEFGKKYDKVDILLNNAGIMSLQTRQETVQGFEKQIGVNHIGHFFLTNLLMDKIKASGQGRIVNVSSLAHTMHSNSLDFTNFMWKKNYHGATVYSASKLCNVYFTKHMA